jgi:hypothetical protein
MLAHCSDIKPSLALSLITVSVSFDDTDRETHISYQET